MQQALELEWPERAIAVTHGPRNEWLFDVTVGPLPPSPAWATFQFEVTEPARSDVDQRTVVTLLFAAVRKMLEEYGGPRPGKVTVS
jgi:hypothetical protein